MCEESEEGSEADPDEPTPESFKQQVDTVLSLLESELERPQSLTYSSMATDRLDNLKIMFTGLIGLKPDSKIRIGTTTSLGNDKLWSSANLHRHLAVLENLIPRTSESSGRAWIDAFFFRASAMLPPNQCMVFNMEHAIPATTVSRSILSTLSGFVDYIAIVASQRVAGTLLTNPEFYALKPRMAPCFFIVEAKLFNPSDHILQAVYEMYACGKLLQQKVLRGALTNGCDWIFILIKLNNDYDGASYRESAMIQLETKMGDSGQIEVTEPYPDLITAILVHWIEKSSVDFGSDDWFEPIY